MQRFSLRFSTPTAVSLIFACQHSPWFSELALCMPPLHMPHHAMLCSSICIPAFVFQLCFSSVFQHLCVSICVPTFVFQLCFSTVFQHLCTSICVPSSVIQLLCSSSISSSVYHHLCSSTCACSITNRLPSMKTLTICVISAIAISPTSKNNTNNHKNHMNNNYDLC